MEEDAVLPTDVIYSNNAIGRGLRERPKDGRRRSKESCITLRADGGGPQGPSAVHLPFNDSRVLMTLSSSLGVGPTGTAAKTDSPVSAASGRDMGCQHGWDGTDRPTLQTSEFHLFLYAPHAVRLSAETSGAR